MVRVKLLPNPGRQAAQAILDAGGGETSSWDTIMWLVELARASGTTVEFYRDGPKPVTYTLAEMEIATRQDFEVRDFVV